MNIMPLTKKNQIIDKCALLGYLQEVNLPRSDQEI